MGEKEDGYLVCPDCRGKLSVYTRDKRIVVTCEADCEYAGFRITGLTATLLRKYRRQEGLVSVVPIEKKEEK